MFKQKYHANDGYYLHVSSTVLLDKGPSFYSSPYKLPLTYMYFTSDVKYVYLHGNDSTSYHRLSQENAHFVRINLEYIIL